MILLLFTFTALRAQTEFTPQVGVVVATGGSVSVMSQPSPDSEKAGAVGNGDFVYCLAPEDSWYEVTFLSNNQPRPGYIPRSCIQFFSRFPLLKMIDQGPQSTTFALDSVTVTLSRKEFIPAEHRLEFISAVQRLHVAGYLDKIDGKTFWGTNGEIPSTLYDRIEVTGSGLSLSLPAEATTELYEPNLGPENNWIWYDKATRTLYICSSNGSGEWGYIVLWVVRQGKYSSRFVVPGF